MTEGGYFAGVRPGEPRAAGAIQGIGQRELRAAGFPFSSLLAEKIDAESRGGLPPYPAPRVPGRSGGCPKEITDPIGERGLLPASDRPLAVGLREVGMDTLLDGVPGAAEFRRTRAASSDRLRPARFSCPAAPE